MTRRQRESVNVAAAPAQQQAAREVGGGHRHGADRQAEERRDYRLGGEHLRSDWASTARVGLIVLWANSDVIPSDVATLTVIIATRIENAPINPITISVADELRLRREQADKPP